ncbi:MAG TPA: VWA domain-containing protein [Pyrinomonadaceae bacterium]|nr:VWA domain-containing protein [Pyrinomonadaceae bacterium]
MFLRRAALSFLSIAFVTVFSATPLRAQSGVHPKPTPTQEDEAESIYTEEVRIPVFAFDENGKFDPRLEVDDVLVVEDGVPQQVKSVRRTPASVLLVLGTGWDLDPALRANTTREIALSVIGSLRDGDRVAAIQFNDRTSVLQDWTLEKAQAARAVKSKLASGQGSNLSRAMKRAVEMLASQPVGNRHLVLIADGIDTASSNEYQDAVKKLIAAQATLHVISYSAVTRAENKQPWWKSPPEKPGATQSAADQATVGIDPTRPPGMRSSAGINPPDVNSGITFDPALRRARKEAEREMKRGEQRLKSLADETGGRILIPDSTDQMVAEGANVAREIDSQYVVTYTPKRPLRNASASEYRKINVDARRLGLRLRARRGYVVGSMRQPDQKQQGE